MESSPTTQSPSVSESNPGPTPASFEDAMKELESLIRTLEEGRLPLQDAVAAYERGVFLKNHCQKVLDEARLIVDTLSVGKDGEGNTTIKIKENI